MILYRKGRVEKHLSVTAKLMLDLSKRAILIGEISQEVFLHCLGYIEKAMSLSKLDSAAQHVDENPNSILDVWNRGITSSRQVSEAHIV